MKLDRDFNIIKEGDVIDIGQTVNGFSRFFVKSLIPLDIRYDYDRERKYEYDKSELIRPCIYTGEPEFKIIPNAKPNP